MCHSVLNDVKFFERLTGIDEAVAEQVQAAGYPYCGGRLHRACYERKPRGVPRDRLGPAYESRISFCCAESGCRRRTTLASVRFLGRRVYLGVVVVVVSALANGVSASHGKRLGERLGVSVRTVQRWRQWWRVEFVGTRFWHAVRGWFMPPVVRRGLPHTLLERFAGETEVERLCQLLCFVCPLSCSAPSRAAEPVI